MRKTILLIFASLSIGLFSQSPNKMSYQSVIRDVSGNLLKNQAISLKISILQTSVSGAVVYSETFNLNTNDNGLITSEIGGGTPLTGAFASIDWSTGTYFIKSEVDTSGGSNYTISGVSQLLSVPYAKYADKSADAKSAQTLIYTSSGF
jgi:hypothetical protein